MSPEALRASAAANPDAGPPAGLSEALQALWYDVAGDWDRAHEICQTGDPAAGAWVHAYLHRREGDLSNAAYWYARAGRPVSSDPLDAEWEAIAVALISE